MSYFRLLPDCFLIEGAKDAAIYDIARSRVFVLDQRAYEILRRCEDNESIDGWLDEPGRKFLETLRDERVGTFEAAPAYVDRFLIHAPLEWKGFCMKAPNFYKVDWSITHGCDLDCRFCATGGKTTSWQACQTCLRRDEPGTDAWWPEDVDAFVDQIAALEINIIHLRGGNPLLEWDRLQAVAAAAARHENLKVVVATPGTGRPVADLVELCADDKVRLNVTLLGLDPKKLEKTTGHSGVLERQLELIDALDANKRAFYVSVLLSKHSRDERDQISRFIKDRWGGVPSIAEAYLKDECGPDFRFSHVEDAGKTLEAWGPMEQFYFRVKSNSCLAGQFAISADGKIRPCAGIHTELGDVEKQGLRAAIADNDLFEMWDLNKSKVEPCKDCALRFACTDCSAAELDAQDKASYCQFDPHGDERAWEWSWEPPSFVRSLTIEEEMKS